MALPASGQISASQINTELAVASTSQMDINGTAVRTLFGVASGQIAFSNGYGKSAAPATAAAWTVHAKPNALMTDMLWRVASTNNVIMMASVTYNYSFQVLFSTDGGATWAWRPLPVSGQWVSVAGGGGTFVINGSPNGYYTTDNGVTWSPISTAVLNTNVIVAYNNNQFVGFENYLGNIRTSRSPTGTTWTRYTAIGGPLSSQALGVWSGSQYFYMADTNTNIGYTSTDLVNWSSAITVSASGIGSSGRPQIASNGAGTVVVIFSVWAAPKACVSTDHGNTWQEVTLPTGSQPSGLYQAVITYNNGIFLIAASDNFFSSANGLTWTVTTTVGQWFGVAYGSGKWVASSMDGQIAIST